MANPVTEGKRAARELRRRLGLSPTQRIEPLAIAKELGVVTVGRPLRARMIAGAYIYRKGADRSFILYNTSEGLFRQRFTVCHELGHFNFDRDQSVVEEISGTDTSPVERRANAFASELLLPEAGLKAYKAFEPWESSPRQVAEVALAYGASFIATLWALCNAQLIDKEAVERLQPAFKELPSETRQILEQKGAEEYAIPEGFVSLMSAAKDSKLISGRRYAELKRLTEGPPQF
jgi:Zn-dependent peptidase ImmA (M78 family)